MAFVSELGVLRKAAPEFTICEPGPPGSGSETSSTRYGVGSFYNQAKIVRKTIIPTVL